jgi:adenylate cyclase
MGLDEVGTLRTLTSYRVIIDRLIASHHGWIFNTAGDSLVADFASAVDAVQCAVEVQEAIARENADRPVAEQMRFRIGIHVGDIMVQGENLFGDAVNIAARLEGLAEPGGICVSGTVQDQIGTKLAVGFIDLGPQQVKNITQPITVLAEQVAATLDVDDAVLDGEIICSDGSGRPQFYDLLRGTRAPSYIAFDIVWLNGADLRELPLSERRQQLQAVLPKGSVIGCST